MRELIVLSLLIFLIGCTYNGPGAQCTEHEDCFFGLGCKEGTCQVLGAPGTGCEYDVDCSPGLACVEGKCAPADRAALQVARDLGQEQLLRDIITDKSIPTLGTKKFTVTVPSITPPEDIIYVDFPSGGDYPLTQLSENVWSGEVPIPVIGGDKFAITRNAIGYETSDASPSATEQNYWEHTMPKDTTKINLVIGKWKWLTTNQNYKVSDYTKPFAPRVNNEEFQDGQAVLDYWWPVFNGTGVTENTVKEIIEDNAGWVEYSPTWQVVDKEESVEISNECGYCYPEDAIKYETRTAKNTGLNVIWRNQIWQDNNLNPNNRSDAWWDSFAQAQRFEIMEFARIANELGVNVISIGAAYDTMDNAILSGKAPQRVIDNWVQTVKDVKSVYGVKTYFDFTVNGEVTRENQLEGVYDKIEPVVKETDYIGVGLWQALSDNCDPTIEEMEENLRSILKNNVEEYYNLTKKPVILTSLAYPSVDCGSQGDAKYGVSDDEISVWRPDNKNVLMDLGEQEKVYEAIFRVVADTPYIVGTYSFGYQRYDAQEKSYNIRGKPAQLVTKKWYELT